MDRSFELGPETIVEQTRNTRQVSYLLWACLGIPNALFATAAARQGDAFRMFPPHSLVNFFLVY